MSLPDEGTIVAFDCDPKLKVSSQSATWQVRSETSYSQDYSLGAGGVRRTPLWLRRTTQAQLDLHANTQNKFAWKDTVRSKKLETEPFLRFLHPIHLVVRQGNISI
jgi:hypothetical protein